MPRALVALLVTLGLTFACGIEPGAPPDSGDTRDGGGGGGGSLGDDGGCTTPCGVGQICVGGTCQTDCPAGTTACRDKCFDLSASNAHCGACDKECIDTEYCNTGRCVVPGCSNGAKDPGELGVDCGGACSTRCVPATASATSCKAIKDAAPATIDGVYKIDPDGAGAGAPFDVFCDMTAAGGGWTALPLRFADGAMWSITQPGPVNMTIGPKTNAGVLELFFSAMNNVYGTTAIKFVPPMPISAVRLVDFNHSPSGSCNSMDFAVGTTALGTNTSGEAWYFADADPNVPRGVVFQDATSCTAPYVFSGPAPSSPAYCSRDGNLGPGLFPINVNVTFATPSPVVQMVLIQGGASGTCIPLTDGERFFVDTPPANDGIWRKGIFVR